MSNLYRFIVLVFLISPCCLVSPTAHAVNFFLDALYWQATETVDWALINDLGIPNQNITYKTTVFNYAPGFRIGGFFDVGIWDSKFFYTHYHTKTTDSTSGNLVSTFLGGKIAQGNNFYRSGNVNLSIDFNMFDWDFGQSIPVNDTIMLRPAMGLRGGWINQSITTNFQGPISVIEKVKNNFRGIGPKASIEGRWTFYCSNDNPCASANSGNTGYELSFFSEFTTSFLWGKWTIHDRAAISNGTILETKVGGRNFGAFTLQEIIGIGLDNNCFSMKIGYEINHWFNQYQVLDDGTGAHNNDLVFQGITLRLSYNF